MSVFAMLYPVSRNDGSRSMYATHTLQLTNTAFFKPRSRGLARFRAVDDLGNKWELRQIRSGMLESYYEVDRGPAGYVGCAFDVMWDHDSEDPDGNDEYTLCEIIGC